jgi:large subunit ribosomal protein L1
MGKIKVAALGSEQEEELREKRRVQREEKKKRESASRRTEKIHISGMKGGERVKAVGAQSEEELEKMAKLSEEVEKHQAEGEQVAGGEEKKTKKRRVRSRSRRYQEALTKIDHNKLYPLDDAIVLLREVSLADFDATVEVHLNTTDKGLRGTVDLPHGTGKKVRVAIADNSTVENLVAEIEKGVFNFDALIAHPQAMPKLARVARILGPKGLMPNPKNGTISPKPEEVAKKLAAGAVNWKTEADFPIIHQILGKMSFKDKQIAENFSALIKSISVPKIKNVTLKSTMSPGIKIQIS